MSIDQQVLEACETISSMPNDEFESRWNPPVEPEEKKQKKSGMSETQSWFEAFLDVII